MKLIINIDVEDIERAVTFYRDALGLQLGRMLFDGQVAEMVGAPVPIQLLQKPARSLPAARVAAGRDYRRHWTPVHLDIEVLDIDDAVKRAVKAGAIMESEIRRLEWGSIATFSDPFGHGFCLLEPTSGGYDLAQ